jgi:hypothetical protein
MGIIIKNNIYFDLSYADTKINNKLLNNLYYNEEMIFEIGNELKSNIYFNELKFNLYHFTELKELFNIFDNELVNKW